MKTMLFLPLLFAAAAANAAGPVTFGAAMPAGAAQPVSQALEQAEAEPGAPAKYAGRITEVCQAKGCWVMLEDGGQAARVMMKDHAFALPKDARGAAVVYGTLQRKTLDAATAQHLAEDAGASAKTPVSSTEYRIVATSVELQGG
jgi:hypothetical protein